MMATAAATWPGKVTSGLARVSSTMLGAVARTLVMPCGGWTITGGDSVPCSAR